jgi:hypothetical protein
MRPSRVMLHLCYDRIPREFRPTWREWKDICKAFGDPRKASIALIAQATAELEKKLKEEGKLL